MRCQTVIVTLRWVFFSLLASSVLWAQATSQISGTVHDETGAAIPGAQIKATQTATGAVRTATSGVDGGYVLSNLPVGPYMLEVTKEGFTKIIQTGIVLQVDSNPTVDLTLKVGAVTEQVTVEAAAAQVETRSTGVGQVVDNQRVSEMPLNGRQPIELVFLAGMASAPGAGAIGDCVVKLTDLFCELRPATCARAGFSPSTITSISSPKCLA